MRPGDVGLVQVLRVPGHPGEGGQLGLGRLKPSGVLVWLQFNAAMTHGSTWGCQRTWVTDCDIAIFRPIAPALEVPHVLG